MEVEQAVDKAVTYCINNNILSEFLTKHRACLLYTSDTKQDKAAGTESAKQADTKDEGEKGSQEEKEDVYKRQH